MAPFRFFSAFLLIACSQIALAQPSEIQMRPRHMPGWNPSALDGRCRLQIWVDDIAEVRIRGEDIRVRTTRGAPSRDEGSDCNQPLPSRPVQNFQVTRVRGRGRVYVSQPPSPANNFTGVVTIEDPQSGGASYTVDVTWRGSGPPGPPPPPPAFSAIQACQDQVRANFLRRNPGGRASIDFRGVPNQNDAGRGRARVQGRGTGRNPFASLELTYDCTVNLSQRVVESANYQYLGNGPRSATGSLQ